MAKKPVKIVIDTNLWIHFLISKNFNRLEDQIFSGQIILQFSTELPAEFLRVINRPKFRKYFSEDEAFHLMELLDIYASFVNVKSHTELCRDTKDNFLLSLALDSKADYLITGDNDLLTIGQFHQTKIMTMADFLKML